MNASGRSVDYLIIGHVSKDLTAGSSALGGTAAYSSLTAQALGKRAAIITSTSHDLDLHPLSDVSIHLVPSQDSTTFLNEYLPEGRNPGLPLVSPTISRHSLSHGAVLPVSRDLPRFNLLNGR